MASGLISGIPLGQSFSRSCQSTTPTLRDIQEKNLGGVSSGHAIPQLHPENSQLDRFKGKTLGRLTSDVEQWRAESPDWVVIDDTTICNG